MSDTLWYGVHGTELDIIITKGCTDRLEFITFILCDGRIHQRLTIYSTQNIQHLVCLSSDH
jgi:hypothetical protein